VLKKEEGSIKNESSLVGKKIYPPSKIKQKMEVDNRECKGNSLRGADSLFCTSIFLGKASRCASL